MPLMWEQEGPSAQGKRTPEKKVRSKNLGGAQEPQKRKSQTGKPKVSHIGPLGKGKQNHGVGKCHSYQVQG